MAETAPLTPARAAAPGDGAGGCGAAVGPVAAAHDVVAVGQRRHAVAAHVVVRAAADERVDGRDGAADAGRAAAPGDGAGSCRVAVRPAAAADHVVAVAQRRDAVVAHVVVRAAADERVDGRDGAADAGCAAAPGDGAGGCGAAVGPVAAAHDVVAVGQRRDAVVAHVVVRAAADERVDGRDGAADAGRAAAPGDGAGGCGAAVGPVAAAHDVVAVGQRRHAVAAHVVVRAAADERVDGRDGAADAGRAAAPGDGAGSCRVAVRPAAAADHVAAVAQRRDAVVAHVVVRAAADERVDGRDGAADAGCAAAPGDGAGGCGAAVGPVAAAHDVVAVGQRRHAVAAHVVVRAAAVQRRNQRAAGAVVEIGRPGLHAAEGIVRRTYDQVAAGERRDAAVAVKVAGSGRGIGQLDVVDRGLRCVDDDVRRVVEDVAFGADSGAAAELERALRRHLDEAGGAGLGPAGVAGGVIRPDDDAARMAVGLQHAGAADGGGGGVGKVAVEPMRAAADADAARAVGGSRAGGVERRRRERDRSSGHRDAAAGRVAGAAGGVDRARQVGLRAAVEADIATLGADAGVLRHHQRMAGRQVDRAGLDAAGLQHAARRRIYATGVEPAVVDHHAGVAVAEQADRAVGGLHAARLDHAAVVDDGADQPVGRLGGHQHAAAFGLDQLAVVGQRHDGAALDGEAEQAAAFELQRHLVACGKCHHAEPCADDALVAHLGAEQGDIAAVGRREAAAVDDRSGAVAGEPRAAHHESLVRQTERRRHQPADVDLRGAAEQHAVRIEQEHLPVGAEPAHDLRGVLADDAVQRDRAGAGLAEGHRGVAADVEALPFDDRAVAGLLDGQVRSRRLQAGLAGGDLAAARQRAGVDGHGARRQQRADGEQGGAGGAGQLAAAAADLRGGDPGGEAVIPNEAIGAIHVGSRGSARRRLREHIPDRCIDGKAGHHGSSPWRPFTRQVRGSAGRCIAESVGRTLLSGRWPCFIPRLGSAPVGRASRRPIDQRGTTPVCSVAQAPAFDAGRPLAERLSGDRSRGAASPARATAEGVARLAHAAVDGRAGGLATASSALASAAHEVCARRLRGRVRRAERPAACGPGHAGCRPQRCARGFRAPDSPDACAPRRRAGAARPPFEGRTTSRRPEETGRSGMAAPRQLPPAGRTVSSGCEPELAAAGPLFRPSRARRPSARRRPARSGSVAISTASPRR